VLPRTLLQSIVPSQTTFTVRFLFLKKILELKRCVVNAAYQAAVISPDLQQRQCLQVLPRNLTLLPSSMPSQRNLTMHLQYLQKNAFSIFGKEMKSKEKH